MAINLKSPTTFTTSVLIGDTMSTPGGSNDSIPSLTQVNGANVSAALEIQSTLGGFLLPRMTSAQIAALVNPVDGMVVFDTDFQTVRFMQNGVFNQSFSTVSIHITAAQFKQAYTAPIALIAPPGAGKAILVTFANIELNFLTEQYEDGGQLFIQYSGEAEPSDNSLAAAGFVAADIINGTTDTTYFGLASAVFLGPLLETTILNEGLFLTNLVGDFTTGDSTFIVNITYTIINA